MSKTKGIVKYVFVAWLLSDEIKWVGRRIKEVLHGRKDTDKR